LRIALNFVVVRFWKNKYNFELDLFFFSFSALLKFASSSSSPSLPPSCYLFYINNNYLKKKERRFLQKLKKLFPKVN